MKNFIVITILSIVLFPFLILSMYAGGFEINLGNCIMLLLLSFICVGSIAIILWDNRLRYKLKSNKVFLQ